jgi:hypothetical protein
VARGWESKSVEEQQSEVAVSPTAKDAPATPEERNRRRHMEGLRLSRARIAQQLAAAKDDRYAEQLRRALAELDKQLIDSH